MATKTKKATTKEDAPESAKGLGFILKRMEKLAGAAGFSTVVLSPTKTKTLISAQLPGSTIETTLPEKLSGLDSPWSFEYAKMISAVMGRKAENLSIQDGALVIKDARYEAKIIGADTSNVPRVETIETPTCELKVNGEVQSILKDALTAVYLQKTLSAMPDITVHVQFKKKTVQVLTWDKSQMVVYSVPNTTGQVFEFTMPLPKASAIFKDGFGEAIIKFSEGVVYVQDGNYKISSSLPPPEEASGVPLDKVIARASVLRDAKLPKLVSFQRSDVVAFLENAKALSRTSALLKFQVNGSKTKVTISADGSSVSATMSSSSKEQFEFHLDIAYVQALISKSKDDLTIAMDTDSFVFKTDELVYAAVLSTAPGSEKTKKTKKTSEEEDS